MVARKKIKCFSDKFRDNISDQISFLKHKSLQNPTKRKKRLSALYVKLLVLDEYYPPEYEKITITAPVGLSINHFLKKGGSL